MDWKKDTKYMSWKEKRKYYRKNAPGPFFQYANQYGIQSQQNTDPIFKSSCPPNDFIILVRCKPVYENKKVVDRLFCISGIIRKNEVKDLFEEVDDIRFKKSKRVLNEDTLLRSNILWYKPISQQIVSSTFQLDELDFPILV